MELPQQLTREEFFAALRLAKFTPAPERRKHIDSYEVRSALKKVLFTDDLEDIPLNIVDIDILGKTIKKEVQVQSLKEAIKKVAGDFIFAKAAEIYNACLPFKGWRDMSGQTLATNFLLNIKINLRLKDFDTENGILRDYLQDVIKEVQVMFEFASIMANNTMSDEKRLSAIDLIESAQKFSDTYSPAFQEFFNKNIEEIFLQILTLTLFELKIFDDADNANVADTQFVDFPYLKALDKDPIDIKTILLTISSALSDVLTGDELTGDEQELLNTLIKEFIQYLEKFHPVRLEFYNELMTILNDYKAEIERERDLAEGMERSGLNATLNSFNNFISTFSLRCNAKLLIDYLIKVTTGEFIEGKELDLAQKVSIIRALIYKSEE